MLVTTRKFDVPKRSPRSASVARCCQMSFNQFHAAEPKEGRSAADVFASSSTVQSSGISSRFASSGKFTAKQLDDGDDGEAPPAAEEDEFDPDDKRPLYERLKAQKDAKAKAPTSKLALVYHCSYSPTGVMSPYPTVVSVISDQ